MEECMLYLTEIRRDTEGFLYSVKDDGRWRLFMTFSLLRLQDDILARMRDPI